LLDNESDERTFARRAPLVQRRILYSAFQIGGVENARRLFRTAADASVPDATRVEALHLLAQWPRPLPVDASTGHWRPLPARPAAEVKDMLAGFIPALSAYGSELKAMREAWDKAPETKAIGISRTGSEPVAHSIANPGGSKATGERHRADTGPTLGKALIALGCLAASVLVLYISLKRPSAGGI